MWIVLRKKSVGIFIFSWIFISSKICLKDHLLPSWINLAWLWKSFTKYVRICFCTLLYDLCIFYLIWKVDREHREIFYPLLYFPYMLNGWDHTRQRLGYGSWQPSPDFPCRLQRCEYLSHLLLCVHWRVLGNWN